MHRYEKTCFNNACTSVCPLETHLPTASKQPRILKALLEAVFIITLLYMYLLLAH